MSADETVVVLDCRAAGVGGLPDLADRLPRDHGWESVGPRPGKAVDPLLGAADRAVVIGSDADLAAVTVRLLRRERLAAVTLGYLPDGASEVARLWRLPSTRDTAAELAVTGPAQPTVLVRDDVGGVLMGLAELSPIDATVYVDAALVLRGRAASVRVVPDAAHGLAVSVQQRRLLGMGHRSSTSLGRAVQFGLRPGTTIVRDGDAFPRAMDRWTFYRHTEPVRVARPA